jgi:CheY-like chemotaxis protein
LHFDFECAENGLQALQNVTGKEVTHFDVILLADDMPIMDGYAACERICSFLAQEKIVDGVPQTLPHPRDLLHALVICLTEDQDKYTFH